MSRLRTLAAASALLLAGVATPALAQSTPQPVPAQALTPDEVGRVVAQAAAEAQARGKRANIVVVDRVGNVLAVFTMTGAPLALTVTSNLGLPAEGLEGLVVGPANGLPLGGALASAIAKAVTGAYLSSSGNAFSTRTASQIVQENFNPGERFQPGGPLFGVQFSQLACSDLSVRAESDAGGLVHPTIGPKRSPLGLSADMGGFPLYKNGVVVGGIGVEADGIYSFDRNITDVDADDEEIIALAGASGFEAPAAIRAERIAADGRTLRYADADRSDFRSNPASAPQLGALIGSDVGTLIPVRGYYDGQGLKAGTAYGTPESGYRAAMAGEFGGQGAVVLVGPDGANRFPIRGGTEDQGALTPAEVQVLLEEAYNVAVTARAQIRKPLNSFVQVTLSVVDTNGQVLGVVRTPDAPIFGTDVSLQKARTSMFFSSPTAGSDLLRAGFFSYASAAQNFLGDVGALSGRVAFSARAHGNLERPFYPDGVNGYDPGPFSKPIDRWSPFNVGLQLDLVQPNIIQHVTYVLGLTPDTPPACTPVGQAGGVQAGPNRTANGIQIFPGGVPIYRGGQLVGGIGISGDGIDQDDMVSFLGLHRAGQRLGGAIGNAPNDVRADRLTPVGARLRYVSCPFSPFLNSREQNPCKGK
ncbi:MAG TPA: heme-binding protein [Azospirillaceae bacterium]|nr:heme-binding protein [Azospirillaceae bacterium]